MANTAFNYYWSVWKLPHDDKSLRTILILFPTQIIRLITERKRFFLSHSLFFELGFVGEGCPPGTDLAEPSEIDDGALKQIDYLVKSL